jgi:hypothetical protein
MIWSVVDHVVVVFTRSGTSEIPRCAAWMIWEAADKGVPALLVSNTQIELEVVVDLSEERLEL